MHDLDRHLTKLHLLHHKRVWKLPHIVQCLRHRKVGTVHPMVWLQRHLRAPHLTLRWSIRSVWRVLMITVRCKGRSNAGRGVVVTVGSWPRMSYLPHGRPPRVLLSCVCLLLVIHRCFTLRRMEWEKYLRMRIPHRDSSSPFKQTPKIARYSPNYVVPTLRQR